MKHVGCLLTKLFGRKSAAMYLYSAFPSVVNSSCDTHTVYTSAWFGSKQSWKYSIGASNPTHLGDPHVILRQSRKARNLNFTFIPFSWIVFQCRNSEKRCWLHRMEWGCHWERQEMFFSLLGDYFISFCLVEYFLGYERMWRRYRTISDVKSEWDIWALWMIIRSQSECWNYFSYNEIHLFNDTKWGTVCWTCKKLKISYFIKLVIADLSNSKVSFIFLRNEKKNVLRW